MLRSVEISAALTGIDGAHRARLYWERGIALSLDCFVCGRAGRTTSLEWGAERAVCSSDEERGPHFAPARIAAFDVTTEHERLALSAVVDFWWAPFQDAKRDVRASPLTKAPWVRLGFAYSCPYGDGSAKGTIQTNLVRPYQVRCEACGVDIAASTEAPTIRLLS